MESDASAFREEEREPSTETPTEPPVSVTPYDDLLKLIKAVFNNFELDGRPPEAQETNFDKNTTLMKQPVPINLQGSAKTKHTKIRDRLREIDNELGHDACTAHCLGCSKTRIYSIQSFPKYKIFFKKWWTGLQKPESFLSWSQSQTKYAAISTPGKHPTPKRPLEEVDNQPTKRVDTGNRHPPNDAETHRQPRKETETDSIDDPNRQSHRAGVFWTGDMSNAPKLGGVYRIGRLEAIAALAKAPGEPEGTLTFPNDSVMKPFIMIPLPEITALEIAAGNRHMWS